MTKQPWWRRVKRYITLRLFGYVNVHDFGMSVDNKDNTAALQEALDYAGEVHLAPGTYRVEMKRPSVVFRSIEDDTG